MKRKHTVISRLSSSSSSPDEEEDEGSVTEEAYDDDSEDEEISEDDASYCSEDEEEDYDANDDDSLCRRVIDFLKVGKDLQALSLKDYKAYLRKHGLRLAGTKAVCMDRVKNHWRIKDGHGESLYPRSSFVVNCTGDVCDGDVVLFTQKVYEKFDKVTRGGCLIGKRTVAGRVVKESYGSAKQQHTFTVEVLWSKGVKKLPPLFPLLVKGRNLYKLKTFRRRWNDEAERLEVLAEKHKRGAAARHVRAMMKSRKQLSATRHSNGDVKHQKCPLPTRPSQTRKTAKPRKGKHAYGQKNDTSQQHGKVDNHGKVPHARQVTLKRNIRSDVGSEPTWKHRKCGRFNEDMDPLASRHSYADTSQSLCPTQTEIHKQTSGHDMGFTSTMIMPQSRRHANTVTMPDFQHQWFNCINDMQHNCSSHHSYSSGRRNLYHYSEVIDVNRQSCQGMETQGQKKRELQRFSSMR